MNGLWGPDPPGYGSVKLRARPLTAASSTSSSVGSGSCGLQELPSAGSDDPVLFKRGDLGGRQSEPVAVDLAVVLAELWAGHGVDRVGAMDA